jgi:hypothetical protein
MNLFIVWSIFSAFTLLRAQQEIDSLINIGNFSEAQRMILRSISENINEEEHYNLLFKYEIIERIKKDFAKTADDILPYLKKYYPDASEAEIEQWRKEKFLESMIIDGEIKFFNNAAPNLFRINPDAKKRKVELEGESVSRYQQYLNQHLSSIKEKINQPVQIKIKYKLMVDADALPDGEVIRAWLPFPVENERQTDILLLSSSEKNFILSGGNSPHSSIYMEKISKAGERTEFSF